MGSKYKNKKLPVISFQSIFVVNMAMMSALNRLQINLKLMTSVNG